MTDDDGRLAQRPFAMCNGCNGGGGFGSNHVLELVRDHDGRDLHLESAERTLAHVRRLWGRDVSLETVVGGKRTLFVYGDKGMTTKALR